MAPRHLHLFGMRAQMLLYAVFTLILVWELLDDASSTDPCPLSMPGSACCLRRILSAQERLPSTDVRAQTSEGNASQYTVPQKYARRRKNYYGTTISRRETVLGDIEGEEEIRQLLILVV